ncbi:cytochrome P450 2D9-like [Vipera latastei]
MAPPLSSPYGLLDEEWQESAEIEVEGSKDDPNSVCSEENLACILLELFIAGIETTFVSLMWAVLLLANHPDIQEKVHKEIEDVFGFSGSISYEDRHKLPYTNAGSIIMTDLRSVLLDPEEWETPEEFNPNHFLDKDGNFQSREAFMPFGAGQRVCLGEKLSRIEMFIFLTSLLRTFSFQLPEGVKKLNEKPIICIGLYPHPYKICAFSKREDHPPGPSRISLLAGRLLEGTILSEKTLIELAKQYGNVYSLWGGNYYIIVFSGYQTVKEALIKHAEAFADRPVTPFLLTVGQKRGIAFSNGHIWLQQRRLSVVTMRKLGLGKNGLETQIQAEVERFLEEFGSKKGAKLLWPRMYAMTPLEMDELQQYVNKNLVRGFTEPAKSQTCLKLAKMGESRDRASH